jgi:glycosyltransferase involved in cell wall biosynthesis
MRILLAHSFYRVTGGEDQYVLAQRELLRTRHLVELLARRNEDLPGGLRTTAAMVWSPRLARQVAAHLARFGPEVIHLHNIYPSLGPAVHLAARRCGIPMVMTVHNLRLRCPNGIQFTKGALCRRCERGAYGNAVLHRCFSSQAQASAYAASLWLHRFALPLERRVGLFLAPSAFLRQRLLDWGIAKERVTLIRNFTDLPSGASPKVGSEGLYLGRLSAEKGLFGLLKALRLAGDPPFRIAGDGPLETELRQLADDLGLRRLRFLGRLHRPAVAKELAAARYLTLPSLCDENAPLAALEALAAGRPLLVSRVGGLPELVAEGAGLCCERGDVTDLASKLDRLATDDELCVVAGTAALRFTRRELGPQTHLRRLEAAYAAVIGTTWGAADFSSGDVGRSGYPRR